MIFYRAIQEGIEDGIIQSVASLCDGGDCPDERCPMQPKDGCACLYSAWLDAPWYVRLWKPEPKRPDRECVLDHLAALIFERSDGVEAIERGEHDKGIHR